MMACGTLRLAVVVAALIAVAGISAPAQARTAADTGAGVAATDPAPELTGLAASVLTRPSAVRGTDGSLHIAYELVLTNATAFAAEVEQVEVLDAKTDRVLLSLAGDALSSRMTGRERWGCRRSRHVPTTQLAPSGSAVVWLDVMVRRKAGLPDALEHRIVSSTRPPAGEEPIQFTSLVARVPLGAGLPLGLGPPVRSGIWGAGEGCCDNDTHHRRGLLVVNGDEVVPQRFAIDWMRLDEQPSGMGRRPPPVVQLPQLRTAPDRRRCWEGGDRPRRLSGSTAAGRSDAAAVRRPPRQSRRCCASGRGHT